MQPAIAYSDTRTLLASGSKAKRMAETVMRSGHASAVVLCPTQDAARLRTELGAQLARVRNSVPSILDITESKDVDSAVRFMHANRDGFIITDKPLPFSNGWRVIPLLQFDEIPDETIKIAEKRLGISFRRRSAAKGGRPRKAQAESVTADLNPIGDLALRLMNADQIFDALVERGLAFRPGERTWRKLKSDELKFRAATIIAWAAHHPRPPSRHPLSSIIYRHHSAPNIQRVDPAFRKRLSAAAPHWSRENGKKASRSPVTAAKRRAYAADRYAAQRQKRLENQSRRLRKWAEVSDAQLCREIWSEPACKVALRYGITDAGLASYCRRAGIVKPPRGFWRKVEKGCIPHPNGRVPRQFAKSRG